MTSERLSDQEGLTIFREAYQHFRKEEYAECVARLKPILGGATITDWPDSRLSLLWAVAGDAFVANNELAKGLSAYRRSIEIDPDSAGIDAYAKAVAKYQVVGEANHALACLDHARAQEQTYKVRWRLVAFVAALFLSPSLIWYRAFGRSRIRRQLATLVDKAVTT